MTIAIICIAFITGVALRFIWEAEESREALRLNEALVAKYQEWFWETWTRNDKLSAELAKYKRPRNPKTGRFIHD